MRTLDEYLQLQVQASQGRGHFNYVTSYVLSASAILASFLAGLSVAANWFCPNTLAVLSALPAVVLIISNQFRFLEKSAWHWRKAYALEGLLHQLRYEGKSEPEVSEACRKLQEQMESASPGFIEAPKNKQSK